MDITNGFLLLLLWMFSFYSIWLAGLSSVAAAAATRFTGSPLPRVIFPPIAITAEVKPKMSEPASLGEIVNKPSSSSRGGVNDIRPRRQWAPSVITNTRETFLITDIANKTVTE